MDNLHPDIIVIMELRVDAERLRRSCHLLGFDEFHFSNGRGFSGGIIVAWKSGNVNISILYTHFQFIHMKVATDFSLLFILRQEKGIKEGFGQSFRPWLIETWVCGLLPVTLMMFLLFMKLKVVVL